MKVGDWVRHKENPNSVLCQVTEIKDLGYGTGFERVKIRLFNAFERYYAMNELEVAEEI